MYPPWARSKSIKNRESARMGATGLAKLDGRFMLRHICGGMIHFR